MERILSYAEADAVVRGVAATIGEGALRTERVALAAAAGRVLAESIAADRDQPPFPRSTRDGFAVRAADLTGLLRVIGQVQAGQRWNGGALEAGQAIEIMTGAPVPEGADAVLMVEHAARVGDAVTALPGRWLAAGENIVSTGAEARAGQVVVTANVRLGPAHIAAAAACGAAEVSVYTRPRVAILATGDELIELEEQPELQQIRNSNSYSLAAQVAAMGAEPVRLPIVRDTLDATAAAIGQAAGCDLILLSGGVSMGKFDYVEQALARHGAEFFFTGARIQPGKPVVFGAIRHEEQRRYFFGLPGNPISAMVTFALFAAPLLAAISGESAGRWPRWTQGELVADLKVKPGLTRFLVARLESSSQSVRVMPIAWQGSGDLASAARADGFVVVPDDAGELSAGSLVTVLLIG